MIYIEVVILLIIFEILKRKVEKIDARSLREIETGRYLKQQKVVILNNVYYPSYKVNTIKKQKEEYL